MNALTKFFHKHSLYMAPSIEKRVIDSFKEFLQQKFDSETPHTKARQIIKELLLDVDK